MPKPPSPWMPAPDAGCHRPLRTWSWPAHEPICTTRATLHPTAPLPPGRTRLSRHSPTKAPSTKTPTPTAAAWIPTVPCTRCSCPTLTGRCSTSPAPPVKWCATRPTPNAPWTTWAPGCTGCTCSGAAALMPGGPPSSSGWPPSGFWWRSPAALSASCAGVSHAPTAAARARRSSPASCAGITSWASSLR